MPVFSVPVQDAQEGLSPAINCLGSRAIIYNFTGAGDIAIEFGDTELGDFENSGPGSEPSGDVQGRWYAVNRSTFGKSGRVSEMYRFTGGNRNSVNLPISSAFVRIRFVAESDTIFAGSIEAIE